MEKELHTFGWYANRIKPHLPEKAFKRAPTRLLGGLVHLIIAVTGILLISLFEFNIWINLVIAFVLGTTFASLGFLGHEVLHGSVVKNPFLRNFIGGIFFFPLTTGPRLWRKWHNNEHHVHTNDTEHDPDAFPTLEEFADKKLLRWFYRLPFSLRAFLDFLFLAFTFSVHSTNMFIRYLKDFNPKNRPFVWLQFIFPWVFWIGFLFLIGPTKWAFAYLIPALIGNFIVMAYIATNHRLNPLVPVNDPLANSLTVTVPKWVDVIHFNFSYHTEHHLFPGMNPRYYPLVKEKIKEMYPERYHEMPMGKALIALWKTPRIYYKNNDLIDPNKNNLYGTLGHGLELNPSKITDRKLSIRPNSKAPTSRTR